MQEIYCQVISTVYFQWLVQCSYFWTSGMAFLIKNPDVRNTVEHVCAYKNNINLIAIHATDLISHLSSVE